MNKKLFETRMRSIEHYAQELANMAEAVKITNNTRNELIASLTEFSPFKEGDILMKNNQLIQIVRITHSFVKEDGKAWLSFKIKLPTTTHYSNMLKWEERQSDYHIAFEDFDNWKILNI